MATLPAYEKEAAPFPSVPSVTIYVTVIRASFSIFLPNIPSPNRSYYLSSVTSCIKNVSDILDMFNILSTF